MTEQSDQKQKVAGLSMLASLALALGKFAVALLTGSLGVLSEALHSTIDFGATVMTWFAVRWADLPPDDDHHFGHAKIESVAALLEAVLLAFTAVFVAYSALHRLWSGSEPPHVEWWAPAIIIVAVVVDYNRARVLRKAATSTSSEALAADAAHFESDLYGSLAVIAGLIGLWLGFSWADSVAALVVSAIVGWIGFELARKTLSTLLDRAPEGLTEEIRTLVERQHGILQVEQLRLRQAGATAFVSVTATVPRAWPATEVAVLRQRLEREIRSRFARTDLNLVLEPVALDSETAFEKVSMIAAEHGLYVHHLSVQKLEEKLAISFDVEVDGATPLDKAHAKVTELEEAIRVGLGYGAGNAIEVESHIEPQPLHLLYGAAAAPAIIRKVELALRSLARGQKSIRDIHNVRVREVEGGLYIHYHCRFAPLTRIDTVHAVVDRMEDQLMAKLPQVKRIVAHAEPIGAPHHEH